MSIIQNGKLEMRNISMEFPGVKALIDVDFTAETGVIHALVGANGAGKSTLMKVLVGAFDDYRGDIYMDGVEVNIRSPKDAKSLGIEIVYQEVDTALIPYLTVAENIMLEKLVNEMGLKQFVNWKELHREAKDVLKRLNVEISTRKIVSELTLAQKQMVLIARAISSRCKYLILDEPTAPLSNTETNELFRVVRDLKKENVGIIFISHRLPELFQICDTVTIMRDGRVVSESQLKETDQNEIIEAMLGRKLDEKPAKAKKKYGEKVLEVSGLSDHDKLRDIDLYVRTGEIVGIAGLVGAGKTELCRALFGASPLKSGQLLIRGQSVVFKTPYQAVNYGLALVPEERRKEGILIQESVITNTTVTSLNNFCKLGHFINFKAEKIKTREIIDNLDIKTPDEYKKVGFLSGGNQQKVAVGKWLIADAEVFIFDEPTKGVDIGAKQDMFELIGNLAREGKSIIYASCDLTEIMGIADRIYVMYDGRIAKELKAKSTTEEELLFYSTGGK